jgi:hypothetical protein
MDIPLFQAALTHATDGFTVSWVTDSAAEVHKVDDLMAALEILRTKIWPA